MDCCQNKCITNDHIYYLKKNNKKLLFYISLLLKLFPISIIHYFNGISCHYFYDKFELRGVYVLGARIVALLQSAGYSKRIDFGYPRKILPCCLNQGRMFLSGSPPDADYDPVHKHGRQRSSLVSGCSAEGCRFFPFSFVFIFSY